jgi:hypothetical protein
LHKPHFRIGSQRSLPHAWQTCASAVVAAAATERESDAADMCAAVCLRVVFLARIFIGVIIGV